MMLEDFTCALPLFIGLGLYMLWASKRQKEHMGAIRDSQAVNREAQELIRESIRVQTEANQVMRELTDVMKRIR